MGWTWYLANDMQFFILLPFFCFLLLRYFKCGLFAIFATIFTQIAMNVLELDVYNILTDPHGNTNKDSYIYVKPWCRITPYVLGILFAYIYRNIKGGKWVISPTKHLCGIALAGSLFASIVFGYESQIACPENDPRIGFDEVSQ